MKHRVTLILCAADLAIWIMIAVLALFSRSDPATRGLDLAAFGAVTALLMATALPAFLMARARRSPALALALALAFPAAFLILLGLIVVALP